MTVTTDTQALDIDALYARFMGDPDWAGFSFEDFLHDETEVCGACGERFAPGVTNRDSECLSCAAAVSAETPFTAMTHGTLWVHNGSVV